MTMSRTNPTASSTSINSSAFSTDSATSTFYTSDSDFSNPVTTLDILVPSSSIPSPDITTSTYNATTSSSVADVSEWSENCTCVNLSTSYMDKIDFTTTLSFLSNASALVPNTTICYGESSNPCTNKSYIPFSEGDLWAENENYARILIPAMVFIALLMVLGIVGNLLVVYIYGYQFKSATQHFLIVCLACFDLLMACIAMPTEIADIRFHHFFTSQFACKLLRFITMFSSISSIFILVTIAIDRHQRVTRPLAKQMTVKRARIWALIDVLLSLVFSWPSLVLTGLRPSETSIPGLHGSDCSYSDDMRDTKYPLIYNIVLGTGFLVLTVVIAILYFRIWKVAKRHRANMTIISRASDSGLSVEDMHKVTHHNDKNLINKTLANHSTNFNNQAAKKRSLSRCLSPGDASVSTSSYHSSSLTEEIAPGFFKSPWDLDPSLNRDSLSEATNHDCCQIKPVCGLNKVYSDNDLKPVSCVTSTSHSRHEASRAHALNRRAYSLDQLHTDNMVGPTLSSTLFSSCDDKRQAKREASPSGLGDRHIVRAKSFSDSQRPSSLSLGSTSKSLMCWETADSNTQTGSSADTVADSTIQYALSKDTAAAATNRTGIQETIRIDGIDMSESSDLNCCFSESGCPNCQPHCQDDIRVRLQMCDVGTVHYLSSGTELLLNSTHGAPKCTDLPLNSTHSAPNCTDTLQRTSGEVNTSNTLQPETIQNYLPELEGLPLGSPLRASRAHTLPSRLEQVPLDLEQEAFINMVTKSDFSHLLSTRLKPIEILEDVEEKSDIKTNICTAESVDTFLKMSIKARVEGQHNGSLKSPNDSPTCGSDLNPNHDSKRRSTIVSVLDRYQIRRRPLGSIGDDLTTISLKSAVQRAPNRHVDKTTIVAFAISSVFVLSFLPYLILMFIRSFVKNFDYNLDDASTCVYNIFVRFYFINSSVNPFLYSVLNARFRQECKRIIFCRFKRKG